MMIPIPVFSVPEAKIKRGEEASEMLRCPACRKYHGVFLSHMNRLKHSGEDEFGQSFSVIVWERWQCLMCRNTWIEKYGIENGRADYG